MSVSALRIPFPLYVKDHLQQLLMSNSLLGVINCKPNIYLSIISPFAYISQNNHKLVTPQAAYLTCCNVGQFVLIMRTAVPLL